MSTMRSVEPLRGFDALMAWLFPFLAGTEPQPGERGTDSNGLLYSWEPGHGWVLLLDQTATHTADAGPGQPGPEPEAG